MEDIFNVKKREERKEKSGDGEEEKERREESDLGPMKRVRKQKTF